MKETEKQIICPYCRNFFDEYGYDQRELFWGDFTNEKVKWAGKDLPAVYWKKDRWLDYPDVGDVIVKIDDQAFIVSGGHDDETFMEINYCPMCGRRLKNESKSN